MIRLALRSLLARKRRTLLISLAVVVGVAQVTGAFVLTDSMNREIDQLFETGQQGIEVSITPAGSSQERQPPIDEAVLQRVRSVDGVRQAVGEVFSAVTILDPQGESVSTGAPSFVASRAPESLSTWQLAAGRWPSTDDETALDQSTAQRAGYAIGDLLPVVGTDGLERLRITGLATFGGSSLAGASVALTTVQAADRLGGLDGRYDSIVVDADPGVAAETLRDRIRPALAGQPVTVQTGAEAARSQAEDLKSQLGFLQPVLLAFGFIALFVGSFVIVTTFSATLAQRSQELAVLRAIGATRRQVTRSVLVESVLIGVVAGVLGLLGGLLVAPGILALFRSSGIDLPGGSIVVEPRTVLIALLVGPLVTGLAGLLPVRRAAAVPPVQAMRGETGRDGARRVGWVAWLLALLAIGATAGSVLTTDGTLGAVLLGLGAALTLVAVAALAPVVLEPILRVVGAPLAQAGQTGRLARLNASRQPRRTTTTAGALMVGVALVTFVSVFAAGAGAIARNAFSERVRADLALTGEQGGFPLGAERVVLADPDVREVAGILWQGVDRPGGAGSVTVAGVDLRGLADVYDLGWVDGDDRLLQTMGRYDVITDRASDDPAIAGARVGDQLELQVREGRTRTVTVRGTIDEGSSLLGGGIIAARVLLTQGEAQPQVVMSLVALRPGADTSAVQRRLDASLGQRYPTVEALTSSELEQRVVGQIGQIVNMIYAFLAFALIVSLLGISTTFTLTVQERRRELAMMRAIGATRRQLRRLVRFEALLTGLIGGVLGVAVGLGFGALVARLLADDGFSFVVPITTVIGVLVLAGLVAALAATLPARRAGKTDIVKALAVD